MSYKKYSLFLKRIWHSPTIMTWGNMISSSVKLLVLTPLILTGYSVTEIAFWYLLLTINSFVIVIDFGFYPTFSRVVSYAFNGLQNLDDVDGSQKVSLKGDPNWKLMDQIYGTVNSTYIGLSFIILFVVFASTYSSFTNLINEGKNSDQLWMTYVIFAISVYFSFFARKFDSIIIGTNHVALINRWNIINNLASTLVSIIIVYLKLDLLWLGLNQLLFSMLLVVRNYYLERTVCGGMFSSFRFLSFDKQVFKWCWSPTWRSGILILCSTGVSQATGLIYSNVANPQMLAAYLLSLKLVTTIGQFSQAPFYSKIPMFSAMRVSNKIAELTNASALAIKKSLLAFALGMGALFIFGDFGLSLIKSKTELVDFRLLIVMSLVLFLERNHAMHAQVYVTTNRVPFYKSAIITGATNVGLIILFLPKIGVWSFPIAQGISNLLINNWWNVKLSINSLNVGFKEYFKKSALVPFCILLLLSIGGVLIHNFW